MIAACAGLSGFAVALIAGLAADNPGEVVLARAVGSLVLCQLVGLALGVVGERTVREAVERYRLDHPVNTSSTSAAPVAAESPGANGVSA